MGPSWYWMPDVFERFFNRFGHTSSDYYALTKLDPGFQMIFGKNEVMQVPANWEALLDIFEKEEVGAAGRLEKFITEAEYKYNAGMQQLVYQPGLSVSELINPVTVKGFFRLQLLSSFSRHVRQYFKSEKLIAMMEFPVLFLGAMPKHIPALYSLMNYAGLKQGTFYPMGGFSKVAEAFAELAKEQGVELFTSEGVRAIRPGTTSSLHLTTNQREIDLDGLIASADYAHVEGELLEKKHRNYSDTYWNDKTFAPSCLIFYLGVNKKLPRLEHHNLFFDANLQVHAEQIYERPQWPSDPLFYVCCPSKTDPVVAPIGKENLFVLMPMAPGLQDNEETRRHYFQQLMQRLEHFTGTNVRDSLAFSRSYCVSDFVADYNAYKGNAYGLANTLRQTANLRPSIKNKRLPNFFYAGQLTVPGPGVPPAIVSGQVAADTLIKQLKHHEAIV